MGTLLYPRLPRSVAHALILERAQSSPTELVALSTLSHPDAEPSATGGQPVDQQRLTRVREAVRDLAGHAGFPNPMARSVAQRFDRQCGSALNQLMEIVPADAAEEGVWSFLTLVVVPEVGPWRFPGQADERLIGRPRNVLRRTWWRAWALGPDLEQAPSGCTPLGEDESVQIMERPSLGGNRRTARAMQSALWRAETNGLKAARSDVTRELARRLRATKSQISLDSLDDSALSILLDQLTAEAQQAARKNA